MDPCRPTLVTTPSQRPHRSSSKCLHAASSATPTLAKLVELSAPQYWYIFSSSSSNTSSDNCDSSFSSCCTRAACIDHCPVPSSVHHHPRLVITPTFPVPV
ncbi:hypothetical protein M758_7G051800 [Ceratodon purpureus]|nr:hypothetical protein M758_7G051800 [Ceratodon purpureus]